MVNTEVYTPREIAQAAGVPVERVIAALGVADAYVPHRDAVRLARDVQSTVVSRQSTVDSRQSSVDSRQSSVVSRQSLFSIFAGHAHQRRVKGMPLAVSSTVHASVVSIVALVTSLGLTTPTAKTLPIEVKPSPETRLVFLAAPGPGGGGGGGGTLQRKAPPKAERKGRSSVSSPMPKRTPPRPIAPPERPAPEPPPPALNSEPLPVVVAPIVQAPADARDRAGVLQEARNDNESRGPGQGGGVGTGTGTGIGQGDGSGVGEGSGGGTGGGPFRPGSGIEPPRLLREVRADYTEDARRRAIEGEVVLEIVVRRDGSVGDVKFLKRLGAGLDERAVQAVRQWRFAPARRRGSPVDVIVEVAVEFKLR
jgi:TonB family protein